jgi:hypothetical protein
MDNGEAQTHAAEHLLFTLRGDPEQGEGMRLYCTHEECRAHAAEELLRMVDALPHRAAALRQAVAGVWLGGLSVRCRRVPRPGPVAAPLPPLAGC